MEEYAEALVKVSNARKGVVLPFPGEKGDGTMVTFSHRGHDARLGLELTEADKPRATVLVRSGKTPWEPMTRSGIHFGFRLRHDPPEGLIESVKGKLERGTFAVDENRPSWFVAESAQAQDLYDLWILPVRRRLVWLFETPGLDTLSFTFTPYLFRARYTPPPAGPVRLDDLVRATLDLLDEILDGEHDHMVRYQKAASASYKKVPSWCGACGEIIEPPKLLCASCLLPQHADCWDTLGRCSQPRCTSTDHLPPE